MTSGAKVMAHQFIQRSGTKCLKFDGASVDQRFEFMATSRANRLFFIQGLKLKFKHISPMR
jgi:hypothetical protein